MFEPGSKIGKYVLKQQLGAGGFGMVFVAHDHDLARDVALKFLLAQHTANPDLVQRFLAEARAAAQIQHGGIVTVYECGQIADGAAFIAMELLLGESLEDRIEKVGAMPPEIAVEIARQIASALAAAHERNIVHRDLKPANVFLVPDRSTRLGERVKVLDFGIAKLGEGQRGATSSVQTGSLMIFGTPRYMSPEQCRSSTNVDARSDIYALGVMLFELLTGARPFDGEPGALIALHQVVPPPTVRSRRPDVPEPLEALVASLLAKQPDDRPPSMDEVIRRLDTLAPPAATLPLASASRQLPVADTSALSRARCRSSRRRRRPDGSDAAAVASAPRRRRRTRRPRALPHAAGSA
ncbi:MAG: serine/threonine protein kinase [Deltaproteobacteria bacterium]|nr:serine/threonine protein kinase [Deltaproteobacteria bacterium]